MRTPPAKRSRGSRICARPDFCARRRSTMSPRPQRNEQPSPASTTRSDVAIAKSDVLELAEGGTVYLADEADLEAWLEAFNDPSRHRCDGDGRLVIWMPPAFPSCSELALELTLRLARAIDAAGLPLRRFGADARFLLDPEG